MNRIEIQRISKALADQTRLMIFEAIAKHREMNCSDIVNLRGVTAATVSHHLKILSDAGLIECRRKGQFVQSRVVPQRIEAYSRALSRLSRSVKRSSRRR